MKVARDTLSQFDTTIDEINRKIAFSQKSLDEAKARQVSATQKVTDAAA